jgi:DNA-binding transcriptional MerR regulator
LKAADFLTISSKKETDVSMKKLKERIEELEKEKAEIKSEASLEKRMMEQKMADLENEKNQAIRNEKLG